MDDCNGYGKDFRVNEKCFKRMRATIVFLMILIFGCSEPEVVSNYVVMKSDGEVMYEASYYEFKVDEYEYEGGASAGLQISIWRNPMDLTLGRASLSEVNFRHSTYGSNNAEENSGIISITEDGGSISGKIEVELTHFENGEPLFVTIEFKNCSVSQWELDDGYLCGKVNERNICYNRVSYEQDEYGNHRWSLLEPKLNHISITIPEDSLKVGEYEWSRTHTPNQKVDQPLIWYSERNGNLTRLTSNGYIAIDKKLGNKIQGRVVAEIEGWEGNVRLNQEFDLRTE